MALIRANGSRTVTGPSRMFSGVTSVAGGYRKENIAIPHTALNWSAGEAAVAGESDRAARPEGARPPVSWAMPRKGGGLAARFEIEGSGAASVTLAAGRNIEAALSGLGTMADSPLELVVSAVAALSGSGGLTANLAGKLEAAAALAGSGNLTAGIGALAGIFADLSGNGTAAGTLRAIGFMEAEITPFTELSPQSLAAAVWTRIVEAGYSAEEVLRLLAAHASGDATGLDGGTIAFKSLDGSKERIEGTISGGTRTVTTRDAG